MSTSKAKKTTITKRSVNNTNRINMQKVKMNAPNSRTQMTKMTKKKQPQKTIRKVYPKVCWTWRPTRQWTARPNRIRVCPTCIATRSLRTCVGRQSHLWPTSSTTLCATGHRSVFCQRVPACWTRCTQTSSTQTSSTIHTTSTTTRSTPSFVTRNARTRWGKKCLLCATPLFHKWGSRSLVPVRTNSGRS